MTRKNEKDTLTGLLALSADKNHMNGQCCSDEELALLVEGNLDTKDRQKCMEHLSHCEKCYNQWLFLIKDEESLKKKRKKIISLRFKKSYKYIGSSLALAASIVVFLNVYKPPLVEVVPDSRDSVILDEKSDSYQDRESGRTKEIGRDQIQAEEQIETLSAPLIKMQKNSSHGKAERKVSKKESLKPAEQGQLLEPIAPVTTTFMRSRSVKRDISLTKDEFYRMIAEGCKKERFDAKYWSDLRIRGTKLLTRQSQETILDSRLVELLAVMKQETWQQQCDEISQLLTEEITPINEK